MKQGVSSASLTNKVALLNNVCLPMFCPLKAMNVNRSTLRVEIVLWSGHATKQQSPTVRPPWKCTWSWLGSAGLHGSKILDLIEVEQWKNLPEPNMQKYISISQTDWKREWHWHTDLRPVAGEFVSGYKERSGRKTISTGYIWRSYIVL